MNAADYIEGGDAFLEPGDTPFEGSDALSEGGDGTPERGGAALDVSAEIVLPARDAAGERVDRFVARVLAGRGAAVSRTRVQQWLSLGAVWSDERALTASTRLAGYETIRVQPLPREADRAFEPDDVALPIVHEDEDLIVIDKPAGLVMHPAPGNWRGTLLNGLLFHRPGLASLPRAGIVHRLDKDTSGLLVVACSDRALTALVAQLADRSMSRRYLAVVQGAAPDAGTVDAPIGRDPVSRVRMALVAPGSGRPSRTHFTTLARWQCDGRDLSLVECRLDTGRTHQIRVHMRALGHPLLGDALYGGAMQGIARQALHAWRLGLRHPSDGGLRHWISVPPDDLQGLVRAAGVDLAQLCRTLDARAGT
ncbi:MAG TPA: RluA family pseudouridine synthase [Quisquiliibacterium sp.]|nr:RluA family pseudouridine synthase [Quisquiliibacterium sp.]